LVPVKPQDALWSRSVIWRLAEDYKVSESLVRSGNWDCPQNVRENPKNISHEGRENSGHLIGNEYSNGYKYITAVF